MKYAKICLHTKRVLKLTFSRQNIMQNIFLIFFINILGAINRGPHVVYIDAILLVIVVHISGKKICSYTIICDQIMTRTNYF